MRALVNIQANILGFGGFKEEIDKFCVHFVPQGRGRPGSIDSYLLTPSLSFLSTSSKRKRRLKSLDENALVLVL